MAVCLANGDILPIAWHKGIFNILRETYMILSSNVALRT